MIPPIETCRLRLFLRGTPSAEPYAYHWKIFARKILPPRHFSIVPAAGGANRSVGGGAGEAWITCPGGPGSCRSMEVWRRERTCPIPLLALPPPIKGSRVRALPRFAAVVSTVLAAGALAGTTPASAAVQPWIASVSAPSTYVLQPWERAAVQIDLTTTAPAQKVEIWAAAASAIPGDALRFEDVVFTPT